MPRTPKSTPETILTYDLGTTRLKVALFSLRGRLLGQRAVRHREHSHDRFVWQDADEWWADAVALTKQLLKLRPCRVIGISVTGRAGAAVFIGRDGTVIGQPWADRRHQPKLDALLAWRNDSTQLSNYGAALLAKKQWFVANEPKRAQQLRHVLYAKDLLIYRLTGLAVTDPASGPDAMDWDLASLAHTRSASCVPRVALPWTVAGSITKIAARALGIGADVPVIVGAHDGICANVGAGAGQPGGYAITLGTHAVVRTVQHTAPAGALRFYGLPPDRAVLGGNAWFGGRAADWFVDLIYGANDPSRTRHFNALDTAAAEVEPGARGVTFLPFLGGQIAPVSRPGARGVFAGMRTSHDRAVLYRAVLEGTAFAIRGVFDQVAGWCGEPTVVRLTGGGARSGVWCQILADVLNRPLEASDEAVEGRGAAVFAAVALRYHAHHDVAAGAMVVVKRRFLPQATRVARYAELFGQWQRVDGVARALDAT